MAGVLIPVIIGYEHWLGEKAMIVTALFKNTSFAAISLAQIPSRWVMLVPTYYLPIHFEAVLNHSATQAGLDLLGLILALVVTSMVVGLLVKKFGKYTPFLIGGPMLCCIGGGLLYTIKPSTNFGNIIGYEILIGVGIGSFMQLGMLASQAEFAKEPHLMGKVMGVITFSQMLGGIVGLAVGGSIFGDELSSNLAKCEFYFVACRLEISIRLTVCLRRRTQR